MRRTNFLIPAIITLCFSAEYWGYFSKPEEFPTYTGHSLTEMVSQLEANINNPEFLYNYAWAAMNEGDAGTAITYIEKAVLLRPQNAFLHYKAGMIYKTSGDIAKARSHLEKALENHYEYLDAWQELITIAPEYLYNLAQLFAEKAHQHSRIDLADQAMSYYQQYIDRNPAGQYITNAQNGIRDMELLKAEIDSREKLRKQQEQQQKDIAMRKMSFRQEMETFRTTKRRAIGLYFNTFGPRENHIFNVMDDKRSKYITKRIYTKDIPGGYIKQEYDTVDAIGITSLSEFGLCGGYFKGPFIFRGNIIFGRSNLKRTYLRDTIVAVPPIIADTTTILIDTISGDTTIFDPGDTISPARISRDDVTIASLNSLRLSIDALYNFYYANPLLFYVSAGADIGYIYLSEKEPAFKFNWIYGAGVGGGAMLRWI